MEKYWICCICGSKYRVKDKDRVIYGCRGCHKGSWTGNNKELLRVEYTPRKRK